MVAAACGRQVQRVGVAESRAGSSGCGGGASSASAGGMGTSSFGAVTGGVAGVRSSGTGAVPSPISIPGGGAQALQMRSTS